MDSLKRAFSPLAIAVLAVALLLGAGSARSQSELEKTLKQYGEETVKGYIQPVSDMFGANMNSGYFHTADVEAWGFHLSLDIVGMAAMVKDDQKMYTASAPAGFNPTTFQTATVFGDKGTEVVDQATGARYRGSDGIVNAQYFPLAVPQLTLGNIYGTQVTVRYLPVPKIGDDKFPEIKLWAVGARHSVSQYLPEFPVDLAAGAYYSSFTLGDFINYKGLAINAQASKSLSILTLYTGLQWEKSTMNLSYTANDAAQTSVNLDLPGANSFRFLAGLQLALGPIKFFGDANFGSVTTLSAGIGFGN